MADGGPRDPSGQGAPRARSWDVSSSPDAHLDPSSSPSSPTPGEVRHGRYVARGPLGKGGMGEVHLAWDPALRRELALKILPPRDPSGASSVEARAHSRFLHEARIGGRLDHPGIVPVYDLGQDDDARPFFCMRLVTGETLQDILERCAAGDDAWTLLRVLGVLLKVTHAMAFAHDQGIVHRDLKPANVMVGRYGEVYVMDWGLAHRLDEHDERDLRPVASTHATRATHDPHDSPLLTMEGDVIGTPAYMSPEQALGRVADLGPGTDVYAVGSILYQLATGSLPYTRPSERISAREVWRRVRAGPPPPVADLAPDFPPELCAICEKAMARRPADRYADMGALTRDLEAFLEGRVVTAYRTGAVVEFRKWVARNRLVAGTIAACLLVVVVGSLSAAAILAGVNDELTDARDLAMLRQSEAEDALGRESSARTLAEDAAHREEAARLLAEAAARREALVRQEAVAAAEREIAARADARWQAYRATISAAAANLQLGDFGNARERLDSADPDLAGWERDVLELRANPALRTWSAGPATHVRALALSPDGRNVASGGSSGTLVLHDLLSGELVAESPLEAYVRDIAFTPDGRRLVVAEGEATVTQRDASTGYLLMRLRGHTGVVNAVACRPDGRLVASASDDRSVRVWDSSTGETVASLAHDAPVTALAFDPAGRLLATAGDDGAVQLFDAVTLLHAGTLAGHVGRIDALAFDAEGETLMSAGADGSARLWDVYSGRARVTVAAGTEVLDAALAPDGKRFVLACADGALRLFDADDGTVLARIEGHLGAVQSVAFADDGQLLVSGATDGTLRLWDVATQGGPMRLPIHTDVAACAALDSSGRWIATGSLDHDLRLLDAHDGDVLATLRGHAGGVVSVAFARDGERLASSDDRGAVLLWDTEQRGSPIVLDAGRGRVASVSASPDGRMLAVTRGGRGNRAYQDGRLLRPLAGEREITLFDAEHGTPLASLPGQAYGTTVSTFSSDGARLATGSQAGGVALWDVASGALVRTFGAEPASGLDPDLPPVSALAFDAEGRTLVSAHLSRLVSIVVWDVATGARRAVLRGHDTRVWSVAVTPDGRRILSTGEDGTIRIWDTNTGEPLLTLVEPGLAGLCLALGPDGRRLLSTGRDGSLLVWDTRVDDARPLWDGAERRRDAQPLLAAMLDEHVLPERALAALDTRDDLAPALRVTLAHLLAQVTSASTNALNRSAWEVVRTPGSAPSDYAWALLRSEIARSRAPDAAGVLNTHGVSLYRVGRFEDALATLARADDLNLAEGVRYPRAGDRLVMAMCLARLERRDEAHALLRECLDGLSDVTDVDILALADEARALLGGP